MYCVYEQIISSIDLQLWQIVIITMLVALCILILCYCIDRLRAWSMMPLSKIFDNIDAKMELK